MITKEQAAELRRLIALAIDAHGELVGCFERLEAGHPDEIRANAKANDTAAAVDRYITSLVVAAEPVVVVQPITVTRPVSSLPDAP